MKSRFFNPYIGPKYADGICGKKVLVLGASFYCNKDGKEGRPKCVFFEQCTDVKAKDSSAFNTKCPEYSKYNWKLEDSPYLSITEEDYPAYQRFGSFMQQFLEKQDEDVWERVAFTDYVQFFLPIKDTLPSFFSKRDFNAFIETLCELQPNIVIVWGLPVTEEIRDNKDNNTYITDWERLPETDYYVCHMRIPEVSHEMTLICCYHPSSIRYWYGDLPVLLKHMTEVLKS